MIREPRQMRSRQSRRTRGDWGREANKKERAAAKRKHKTDAARMLSIIKKQGPTQDSSDEKQKEDDERAKNGQDAYGRRQNVGQSKNNVMAIKAKTM